MLTPMERMYRRGGGIKALRSRVTLEDRPLRWDDKDMVPDMCDTVVHLSSRCTALCCDTPGYLALIHVEEEQPNRCV